MPVPAIFDHAYVAITPVSFTVPVLVKVAFLVMLLMAATIGACVSTTLTVLTTSVAALPRVSLALYVTV